MTTTSDSALLDLYDEWQAAIVANDADAIGSFMTEDWIIVSESGVTTADRFLGLVRSGALTHSAMRRVGEPRLRYHGEVALLTTRVTNTAHYRSVRFDADEWTSDVFVRVDGRWRCALTHITARKPD
ncbi:nuclear transport factor 2 family protein [Nocardia rhizosphaerae]|uniref:Nuclear transport factor 2 family protein n=1 Tax=Nocardia rhizosphaerae TaxID=1691571 RepID=A0ABV8L8Q8_9NOCA